MPQNIIVMMHIICAVYAFLNADNKTNPECGLTTNSVVYVTVVYVTLLKGASTTS